MFGVCEFGETVGMAFNDIKIQVIELKWYLLPRNIRKMLPIILIVAHEPVEFDILGSTACSRRKFKEVRVQTAE